MPRTIAYRIHDEPDGRFTVVATMEPDRIYRRHGLRTLAEAEDWIEGLRVLMAACGAPVVQARACPGDATGAGRDAARATGLPG